MIDETINFDTIEKLIKEYRELNGNLNKLKTQLNDTTLKLKELRKDLSNKSKSQEILSTNTLRDSLKEEISDIKKTIKNVFTRCEELIFEGIKCHYSEVYEKQLSRLYGYKITIINKAIGDEYDENLCSVKNVITTKNKALHKKILKMLDFGILENADNVVVKKAVVEISVYNKGYKVGTVLPFDMDLLWYKKNTNI